MDFKYLTVVCITVPSQWKFHILWRLPLNQTPGFIKLPLNKRTLAYATSVICFLIQNKSKCTFLLYKITFAKNLPRTTTTTRTIYLPTFYSYKKASVLLSSVFIHSWINVFLRPRHNLWTSRYWVLWCYVWASMK